MNITLGIIAALVGLLGGGIINALADDLPGEDIPDDLPDEGTAADQPDDKIQLRPPHYPDGAPRRPIAWLGVLAFLMGQRRSPGGAKLSWRHPITEIVTALLFAYVAVAYPFSASSLFWMGNLAILVLITVIDLEHRLILFVVVIPAYVYALIAALVYQTPEIPFKDYLIGGAVGFGVFFLMYLGGILFSRMAANARGEELEEVAFGYGDVMLATLSGLMLGWQALIFAITIAVFAGAAGAILYLLVRLIVKGRYEFFTALPYGQYIVLGTVIMMLWRDPVRAFIQNTR
jgi:leader peptidase (prepilin peptidase) / N-methyltransferase